MQLKLGRFFPDTKPEPDSREMKGFRAGAAPPWVIDFPPFPVPLPIIALVIAAGEPREAPVIHEFFDEDGILTCLSTQTLGIIAEKRRCTETVPP
jgi:hypothetical protein